MAFVLENDRQSKVNQAGYTASGAPKHVDKRRRYGLMDGWTDGQTGRPSYTGASEHLKRKIETQSMPLFTNLVITKFYF